MFHYQQFFYGTGAANAFQVRQKSATSSLWKAHNYYMNARVQFATLVLCSSLSNQTAVLCSPRRPSHVIADQLSLDLSVITVRILMLILRILS